MDLSQQQWINENLYSITTAREGFDSKTFYNNKNQKHRRDGPDSYDINNRIRWCEQEEYHKLEEYLLNGRLNRDEKDDPAIMHIKDNKLHHLVKLKSLLPKKYMLQTDKLIR